MIRKSILNEIKITTLLLFCISIKCNLKTYYGHKEFNKNENLSVKSRKLFHDAKFCRNCVVLLILSLFDFECKSIIVSLLCWRLSTMREVTFFFT